MPILINFVDLHWSMPNYYVTLEAAWLVKDVKSVDDAIGIAILEVGKRLNPKLSKVEVKRLTSSPQLSRYGVPFNSRCDRGRHLARPKAG